MHERYKILDSVSAAGVFCTDPTGRQLVYANARWRALCGLSEGQPLQEWSNQVHPEDRERVIDTRDFVLECLEWIAERRERLVRLVAEVDRDAGDAAAARRLVPLRTRVAAFPERVKVLGWVEEERDGERRRTDEARDYEVELVNDFRPERSLEESIRTPTAQLQDTNVFDDVTMGANAHNRFYGGLRFIAGVLQLGDLGPHYILAVIEQPLHRRLDALADHRLLRGKVDEGDRLVRHLGVFPAGCSWRKA